MANGGYTAHRENQKLLILETAEDLFINRGIEQVTLGDIAKAARLTRATLYKYFANKEEIAAEIFKNVTSAWVERNERDVWSGDGSGCELVRKFVETHFEYLLGHIREARFIAEFDYMYSKKMSVEAAMRLFSESLEADRRRLDACVRKGQADGSIRKDIAPEVLVAGVLTFNSGMMNRLGELGDKMEVEFGLTDQDIFRRILCVFLDGLRPVPPGV